MTPRAIRLPFCALALSALVLVPLKARAVENPDPVASGADAGVTDSPADTGLPSVEWPLKHLYCVEYARLRSGLAIFGDARLWWSRARDLYAEFTQPAVDAVMVFAGSKRIRKGHVAVVTQIVSPREIVIDHANWQNRGEIDRNMPVLDVSTGNDWSRVRVWNINTGQFGSHIYRISGFIAGNTRLAVAGS